MANNLTHLFTSLFGGVKGREDRDTLRLYEEAKANQRNSPFFDDADARTFIYNLVQEACELRHPSPTPEFFQTVYAVVYDMLFEEGYRLHLPEWESISHFTIEQGVAFREHIARNGYFIANSKWLLTEWRQNVVLMLAGILDYFPLSVFPDDDNEAQANAIVLPQASAYDLCENLNQVVEGIIDTHFARDIVASRLFEPERKQMEVNLLAVSGISRTYQGDVSHKLLWPTKNKTLDPVSLVNSYLGGTPFLQLFEAKVPFAIPFPARFEHTHIVAGSGHGKTQLLQFLILHDLQKALEDGRSVLVMDSQGDLIRTISHLKLFGSSEDRNLADRFVLVDPTDVAYPVGLNMFDFDRARMGNLSDKDRETILNATVETYEYFFGALLGAELTQRQGVIFRYIARLMMEIPGATIHTLLELMINGEKYRQYMDKLPGTARTFFQTQFFDRQFVENKKQVTARLWGVLSNTTLERMFSHPENKLDLFRLTQEGKIILINTAKDFLGHEGSCIFGRFIVSLIAQAAIQRAILPAYQRTPTFAYIDEAEDYFDENIDRLVNQARKYKIGLVFSHQNLDQLSPALRASVLASTSIKFAGGLSSKDANALDGEFRVPADFLLAQKKRQGYTEFACYVKNYSPKALSLQIPLGHVERQPALEEDEYEMLLAQNRERYSVTPVIPDIEPPAPAAPAPKREGRPARPPKPEPARTPEPAPVPEAFEEEEAEALSVPETPEAGQEEPPQAPRKPVRPVPKPAVPRYAPKEPGGGGRQHKYLANLVKGLAEERGFRASIEEEILDGAGRVDVALSRGVRRIAVEISVTTGRDWELGNVEKCLSAGYEEVLVVSTNERHLKSLARFIPDKLEEKDREKVRYFSPEQFIEYLGKDAQVAPTTTEKVVRGYKVRVTSAAVSEEEAEARRQAIAEVIAKSMLRGKEK